MDLVAKYFSADMTSTESNRANTFYPPADLEMIKQTERILSTKLPKDYVDFLLQTNGYEGQLGQSYSIFTPVDKIEEFTQLYGTQFFPWIIFIGTDGGGDMYVIDKRTNPLQFGLLPFISSDEDFIPLGDTFEEFIKHLYDNDFWTTTDESNVVD